MAVGGADTQCGLLGAGVVAPGELGVIAGTSSPVLSLLAQPQLDPSARLWTVPHVIAGRLLHEQRRTPGTPLAATLAEVSSAVLGAPLVYSDAALAEITSARHFVAVRRSVGGPAPEETARALDASRAVLAADRAWVSGVREALAAATVRRRDRSRAL